MKSLSIRQKLFAAFVAVLAIPLGLSAYLSIYYLQRETAVMEADRQAKVDSAFHAMMRQSDEALLALRTRLHQTVKVLAPSPHEIVDLVLQLEMAAADDEGIETLPGSAFSQRVQQRLVALKQSEPAIRGCKLILDVPGEGIKVILDELNPAFDWNPRSIPDSASITDKPMIVEQERLDRVLIIAYSGTREVETLPGVPGQPAAVWLVAEVDPGALIAPTPVCSGWAFLFDTKSQAIAHTPPAIELLRKAGLPLAPVVAGFEPSMTFARREHGPQRFLVHAAPQMKEVQPSRRTLRLFAVIDEAAFWRPLRLRAMALLFGFLTSLSLAVLLAYYLSGRFVGTLSALSDGAEAIARGDFQAFEQRSTDEFGRLAESMNRMAERLAQRMRKEEIDGWRRLVRVLSHEINNTLGPVRSVAGTVRDQIATRLSDDDAAEDLQLAFRLIIDRTDALSSFIANYAELAKLPDPDKQPSELGTIVKSAIELLGDLAAQRSVKILDDLDPTLPPIPLDRAQLERVVINVVKNAIEAAPPDSVVTVHSERSIQGIELCVEDSGPGISADARRHLFVPYFTTKPGGSGLGLALVRQIVLGHGGSVVAEDRTEGGTRVRITLPPS